MLCQCASPAALLGGWDRPTIDSMSAEQFVQASYRGLQFGERLKLFDFGPNTAHLEVDQPLPHGTPLELQTEAGVQIPVIVVRVHEKVGESEAIPGMRVHAEGLSGDAKEWWSALVSTEDPTIPEPPAAVKALEETPAPEPVAADAPEPDAAEAPAAEPEPAVATDDSDGVPDAIEAQATNPVESRTSTKRTQIMNVAEIQAAIAEEEGAAPEPAEDANKTQQMSQDEVQALLEKERAAAKSEDEAPKKKKKKRRKKKR